VLASIEYGESNKKEKSMKTVMTLLAAVLLAAVPAHAAIIEVEITGEVEWNFARAFPLTEVNVGDPVTMYFEVDSDVFMNSTNFSTRGYDIDMASYSITLGSVKVGLQDPYNWGIPYFVIRESDPVADGFFVSGNNVDWPFPGLPLEVFGFCGPFESHFDVSYTGDTLTSLDILDALGNYEYDGLTRFYFNEVDCGFEVIGVLFEKLSISLAPVEVPVDVKPGSCPNPLNTTVRGDLPVAVLGAADLDVTTIDPASIRLEGVAPIRSGYEDVGAPFEPYVGKQDCSLDCNEWEGDGWMDLTLKFAAHEIGNALGDVAYRECVPLTLTGNFMDEYGGGPIIGEDVVVILNQSNGSPQAERTLRMREDRIRRQNRPLVTDAPM
jgi:hypothetical protein